VWCGVECVASSFFPFLPVKEGRKEGRRFVPSASDESRSFRIAVSFGFFFRPGRDDSRAPRELDVCSVHKKRNQLVLGRTTVALQRLCRQAEPLPEPLPRSTRCAVVVSNFAASIDRPTRNPTGLDGRDNGPVSFGFGDVSDELSLAPSMSSLGTPSPFLEQDMEETAGAGDPRPLAAALLPPVVDHDSTGSNADSCVGEALSDSLCWHGPG